MCKLHDAALVVMYDEVAAPRYHALKVIGQPIALEVFLAGQHGKRLAQLLERERPSHSASPAKHTMSNVSLAALTYSL
jgi:hypothetical protein